MPISLVMFSHRRCTRWTSSLFMVGACGPMRKVSTVKIWTHHLQHELALGFRSSFPGTTELERLLLRGHATGKPGYHRGRKHGVRCLHDRRPGIARGNHQQRNLLAGFFCYRHRPRE